jgi:hypothetical protein
MPTVDRMFRVIVAGGIALSATTPGLVVGCGGSTATTVGDGGGADGFPTEGPYYQPDAFPQETAQQMDAFPQEGTQFDAGLVDSRGDEDVFPQEGPPPIDAGSLDASSHGDAAAEAGFPQETASP